MMKKVLPLFTHPEMIDNSGKFHVLWRGTRETIFLTSRRKREKEARHKQSKQEHEFAIFLAVFHQTFFPHAFNFNFSLMNIFALSIVRLLFNKQ